MEVKKDETSFLQNMKQEINQNTEEEKNEILKKSISSHPLYGLLVHSHLSCLKVCSGDFDLPEMMNTVDDLALAKLSLHSDSSLEATTSELDQFMEAYCLTLRELKEAMEKPLIETHRIMDAVYNQLNDIVLSSSPP
ncbi:Protein KNATM [Hirschfeldia incana]|nr:Protein KNATM [Hirschfeldia incana]